jgi:hypothetical protein
MVSFVGQSFKVAIHFGTLGHPTIQDKCEEFIDEMITRRKTHILLVFLTKF